MSYNTDNTAAQYTGTVGIPPRERAELLAEERCRLALDVLSGRTTPVELDELALEIAAQEAEAAADVKVDLHHSLLPRLEKAGVIDYDHELGTVERKDAAAGADETDGTGCPPRRSTLSDELRTHVSEYFGASSTETASLDDLSRYAATELADSNEWPAERIQLCLHHVVLPKLDADSVIEYDPRSKTVRCREGSS